ncbi:MAG: tRNA uridine-5-carboxymethylaminomethyl(34) synthesis GTPase MnmE [bacterium]
MAQKKRPALGDETIAATITPPGQGGVAALRLAGPLSHRILGEHFKPARPTSTASAWTPMMMRHGFFCDETGQTIDEVMAVVMPAGGSYTGEQQAEIFCHGGYAVVRRIFDVLLAAGARAAEPGEFTKLAFLNGRIDLTQAEAVADIIAAHTRTSLAAASEHAIGAYAEHVGSIREQILDVLAEVEASLDYPEEDLQAQAIPAIRAQLSAAGGEVGKLVATYERGRIVHEGFKCAIAGRPNVGKSSLFNLLIESERALVAATPGTTRDYLDEWINLDGVAVQLIDTAGFREDSDEIEMEGQRKAIDQLKSADLVLWLVDVNDADWAKQLYADLKTHKIISKMLVGNKIDILYSSQKRHESTPFFDVEISCLTGEGVDRLRGLLSGRIHAMQPDLTSGQVVTSQRHAQKLSQAESLLQEVDQKLADGHGLELAAFDIRQAITAIDEIIGRVYNEEVLDRIFSKFCVGK